MKSVYLNAEKIGKVWQNPGGEYQCCLFVWPLSANRIPMDGIGKSEQEAVDDAVNEGWNKAQDYQTAADALARGTKTFREEE